MCLQCRHSRYALKKSPSEYNPEIKEQALSFLDHILATERKQKYRQACLAFFHYGRYAYQVYRPIGQDMDNNLLCLAKKYIDKKFLAMLQRFLYLLVTYKYSAA